MYNLKRKPIKISKSFNKDYQINAKNTKLIVKVLPNIEALINKTTGKKITNLIKYTTKAGSTIADVDILSNYLVEKIQSQW